jgi:hypothetical protein
MVKSMRLAVLVADIAHIINYCSVLKNMKRTDCLREHNTAGGIMLKVSHGSGVPECRLTSIECG